MKKRRVFDRTGVPEAFKRMARTGVPVELSHAKGSVQEAACELGSGDPVGSRGAIRLH